MCSTSYGVASAIRILLGLLTLTIPSATYNNGYVSAVHDDYNLLDLVTPNSITALLSLLHLPRSIHRDEAGNEAQDASRFVQTLWTRLTDAPPTSRTFPQWMVQAAG